MFLTLAEEDLLENLGGLWPKGAEEIERTGFDRVKGSYYFCCPRCVSNRSSTSLSPPASQGQKICKLFTVQKSHKTLLPQTRGFLTVDNYSNRVLLGSAKPSFLASLSPPLAGSSAVLLISLQPGFLIPSLLRGCCSGNLLHMVTRVAHGLRLGLAWS